MAGVGEGNRIAPLVRNRQASQLVACAGGSRQGDGVSLLGAGGVRDQCAVRHVTDGDLIGGDTLPTDHLDGFPRQVVRGKGKLALSLRSSRRKGFCATSLLHILCLQFAGCDASGEGQGDCDGTVRRLVTFRQNHCAIRGRKLYRIGCHGIAARQLLHGDADESVVRKPLGRCADLLQSRGIQGHRTKVAHKGQAVCVGSDRHCRVGIERQSNIGKRGSDTDGVVPVC